MKFLGVLLLAGLALATASVVRPVLVHNGVTDMDRGYGIYRKDVDTLYNRLDTDRVLGVDRLYRTDIGDGVTRRIVDVDGLLYDTVTGTFLCKTIVSCDTVRRTLRDVDLIGLKNKYQGIYTDDKLYHKKMDIDRLTTQDRIDDLYRYRKDLVGDVTGRIVDINGITYDRLTGKVLDRKLIDDTLDDLKLKKMIGDKYYGNIDRLLTKTKVDDLDMVDRIIKDKKILDTHKTMLLDDKVYGKNMDLDYKTLMKDYNKKYTTRVVDTDRLLDVDRLNNYYVPRVDTLDNIKMYKDYKNKGIKRDDWDNTLYKTKWNVVGDLLDRKTVNDRFLVLDHDDKLYNLNKNLLDDNVFLTTDDMKLRGIMNKNRYLDMDTKLTDRVFDIYGNKINKWTDMTDVRGKTLNKLDIVTDMDKCRSWWGCKVNDCTHCDLIMGTVKDDLINRKVLRDVINVDDHIINVNDDFLNKIKYNKKLMKKDHLIDTDIDKDLDRKMIIGGVKYVPNTFTNKVINRYSTLLPEHLVVPEKFETIRTTTDGRLVNDDLIRNYGTDLKVLKDLNIYNLLMHKDKVLPYRYDTLTRNLNRDVDDVIYNARLW